MQCLWRKADLQCAAQASAGHDIIGLQLPTSMLINSEQTIYEAKQAVLDCSLTVPEFFIFGKGECCPSFEQGERVDCKSIWFFGAPCRRERPYPIPVLFIAEEPKKYSDDTIKVLSYLESKIDYSIAFSMPLINCSRESLMDLIKVSKLILEHEEIQQPESYPRGKIYAEVVGKSPGIIEPYSEAGSVVAISISENNINEFCSIYLRRKFEKSVETYPLTSEYRLLQLPKDFIYFVENNHKERLFIRLGQRYASALHKLQSCKSVAFINRGYESNSESACWLRNFFNKVLPCPVLLDIVVSSSISTELLGNYPEIDAFIIFSCDGLSPALWDNEAIRSLNQLVFSPHEVAAALGYMSYDSYYINLSEIVNIIKSNLIVSLEKKMIDTSSVLE